MPKLMFTIRNLIRRIKVVHHMDILVSRVGLKEPVRYYFCVYHGYQWNFPSMIIEASLVTKASTELGANKQ